MKFHCRRPLVLVVAGALGIAAACDDSAPATEGPEPPSISIRSPDADALVRQASFDITGRFFGSVITIDVSIDGGPARPALRGEEANDWRLPARDVSVAPGLHSVIATATGEAGVATDGRRFFYEPDTNIPFEMRIVPDTASYEVGTSIADRTSLHLFGPADSIRLDVTSEAPPPLVVRTNTILDTGSPSNVDIDIGGADLGDYPVVVRAVSADGFEREATHVVTIIPSPVTTPPPPTQPSPTRPTTTVPGTVVLSDDFEGADLWTSAVVNTTNGSEATAELAAGGNPGGQRVTTHDLPGTGDGEDAPTLISVLHTFTGGGWDPATDGPLASIDYAEDHIMIDPPFEGAAVGATFAVIQDGTQYTAPILDDNAIRTTTWETVRVTGLTPSDFSPAPGPDFSANGSPMSFGYLRSNTNRSETGIVTTHGIDNWTVALHGA